MKGAITMKRKSTTRRFAAVMTIMLAIALILTGTYAWQSISQQALNQSIGAATPAGGRLHNDMEIMGLNFGENEWAQGSVANKDVYVENYESEQRGRDIFVRVRLYEYMEIGDGAKLHPGDVGFDTRAAESIIFGADREDVTTWAPRLPGDDAISDLFRSHFEWSQGGQKWYMPTFNQDNFSLESDVKGDAVDPHLIPGDETINSTRRGEDHEYPAEAGLHDFFEVNTTHSGLLKTYDRSANGGLGGRIVGTSTVLHTAKETLNATVVHIKDWDEEVSNVWVLDDDGWAYWAAPLEPDTATGLLLNSIKLINAPELEWYYGIFVDAEMATISEVRLAFAELTPEAEVLLSVIAAEEPMVHSMMREDVLTPSSVRADTPFLTFSDILRGEIEHFEFLDLTIPGTPENFDATEFMTDMNSNGGFGGKTIIEAQDWTHPNSIHPVVAFYTEGNTTGLYNFYIAGDNGIAATGRSMYYFFAFMDNLVTIDVTLLDTSRVTNMGGTFREATRITSLNLSGFDTSSVTTMGSMFYGARNLTSLNLSSFDTSSVTSMGSMFREASGLTNLDLSNFDTSSVTAINGMFMDASGLTSLDLSGFDTSNVTLMSSTFRGTTGLTNLDLSSFDTSNVTTMANMFYNATGLTSLDVSSFDTSKVTTMQSMFYNTIKLTSLNLSSFDTSSVTVMRSMFYNASTLTSLDLSKFDTSSVTNMINMFRGTTALISVDFRQATFGAVETTTMFTGSGISEITVGSAAAQDFILAAPGWTRVPARIITIV